ncbi:MAG: bifunctional GTP diphosphokinase/guanosine-3',5'-bis(diphosphate) 3'-diphosphatase [Gammaproteobacteria bacterium RBG_16_57_12]|nr:MAG: bifunctional GTP diphosphokinase/guanosine-3',5'-bis(diphosphate) 3'-diphosphatase [Gammaproteobacteria bacterium RBG_16_57_12]
MPVLGISDLCDRLSTYLEPAQVADVYRAYEFSARAHAGQHRLSGEPYISHPLEVASILADMRMDSRSIVAAILHDVIEDTPTAKEHIAAQFGEEVAELVDGVSKLTQVKFESAAEAQAANFRKMMLAMVRDIRVILIKLADRLHNMRTLGVMRPDKCRRIAMETLEIYVPIAHRLGMNTLRLELEELGFQAYYPARYRVLREAMLKARGNRKEIIQTIDTAISERLRQEKLPGRVLGREKHLYSLYRKMRDKRLPFAEVLDVYAFRIVVDTVDTCYRVLGAIHNLYKPVPGRFKDYIAIPKSNGYQSLHTVLFGPYGVPIEVQIRTEEMNRLAEAGIAAHWLYKTEDKTSSNTQQRAHEWLRSLLELQQNAGNSLEFLENVKIDLFPDEVYVFTPKGQILELPRGATAVDFAYAVHSQIGNTCVAVKIDRKLMPLRTPLLNGQTVEVITAPGAHPNPVWLDFAVTGKARATIRNALKNLRKDEAAALGRRMLNKALLAFSSSLDAIPPEAVARMLKEMEYASLDQMLEALGLGARMPLLVARSLMGVEPVLAREFEAGATKPLWIKGTEGMVVSFARCCRPIPGDPILGFISAGRGIVIHDEHCKNVSEFRNKPEKWIDVQWDDDVQGEFLVEIRVDVANRRGVLATVAACLSDNGANIENVSIQERDGIYSAMNFVITVSNRIHLANILRRLRAIPEVGRINRVRS